MPSDRHPARRFRTRGWHRRRRRQGVSDRHGRTRWASGIAACIPGSVLAACSVDAKHDSSRQVNDRCSEKPTARVHRRFADVEYVEQCGTDPASTLRDVAAQRDAALIVVSAKQHHNLGGTLLGAVADHLLHHPTCSVAVLPPGFEASWPSTAER